MDKQNIDILERIHGSYYQLTATERRVADYVLAQPEQVKFMSITQLADECGTADATISRFCRSLKLKGFNAFKIELARHSTANVPVVHHDTETLAGRARQVGTQSADAIAQTMDLVEPHQVERAVEMIEKANRCICIGSGGSAIMATTFAHLFSAVTGKFQAITDSHMQMSAVATMGKDDIIILFSYSGATNAGLQILELAKERGIRSVLVTRFNKSPAATLADVVLRCGSNEGPFQSGSVAAKVAQLVVMDVLYQEYCHRNRESCEENIQRIAAALSNMHV